MPGMVRGEYHGLLGALARRKGRALFARENKGLGEIGGRPFFKRLPSASGTNQRTPALGYGLRSSTPTKGGVKCGFPLLRSRSSSPLVAALQQPSCSPSLSRTDDGNVRNIVTGLQTTGERCHVAQSDRSRSRAHVWHRRPYRDTAHPGGVGRLSAAKAGRNRSSAARPRSHGAWHASISLGRDTWCFIRLGGHCPRRQHFRNWHSSRTTMLLKA